MRPGDEKWRSIEDKEQRRLAGLRYRAYLWYQNIKNDEGFKLKNQTKAKAWGKEHPEKQRATKRKWIRENKYRAKAACRKGQVGSLLHPDHSIESEMEFYRISCDLTDATGIVHQVDHIIPLRHGGWHHHLNMQILPRGINQSKHSDPFWELPGYKSWRDVPERLWPEHLAPSYLALKLKS